MISREHTSISAVTDEIVIDDLVGLALLDAAATPPRIVWANPAFSSVLSRGAQDLAGVRLGHVIADIDLAPALDAAMGGDERTVRLASTGRGDVVLQLSPTGERRRVLLVARPVHATPRAALYDPVTGLPSLALFREHLQLALNRRGRNGDDVAVMAVGAANFAAAWQQDADAASLLQTRVAERIEQVVRDADVLTVQRPGAFMLLVADPSDAVAAATLVSERIITAFETPLVMSDRLLPLDVHIGIAAALPEDSPDQALTRADTALATAARAGANRYRVLLT